MAIDRLNPDPLDAPTGMYSLLSIAPSSGRLAVVSGQTGRRDDGSLAPDASAQAANAIANVRTALEAVGAEFSDVLLLRWLVTDREVAEAVRATRDRELAAVQAADSPPSSTMAIVTGLADRRALVEVEAWFVIPNDYPES